MRRGSTLHIDKNEQMQCEEYLLRETREEELNSENESTAYPKTDERCRINDGPAARPQHGRDGVSGPTSQARKQQQQTNTHENKRQLITPDWICVLQQRSACYVLATKPNTFDIYGKRPVPCALGSRHGIVVVVQHHPCIVEQDIDAAEIFLPRINHGLAITLFADICLDKNCLGLRKRRLDGGQRLACTPGPTNKEINSCRWPGKGIDVLSILRSH